MAKRGRPVKIPMPRKMTKILKGIHNPNTRRFQYLKGSLLSKTGGNDRYIYELAAKSGEFYLRL